MWVRRIDLNIIEPLTNSLALAACFRECRPIVLQVAETKTSETSNPRCRMEPDIQCPLTMPAIGPVEA